MSYYSSTEHWGVGAEEVLSAKIVSSLNRKSVSNALERSGTFGTEGLLGLVMRLGWPLLLYGFFGDKLRIGSLISVAQRQNAKGGNEKCIGAS